MFFRGIILFLATLLLASCDDGDPCTLDSIYGNAPIVCISSDTCYVGVCNDGICTFDYVCDIPHECSDHDACTIEDVDTAGNCIYIPIQCPSDDSCHVWFCINGQCDSINTCNYIPPTNCDDGDDCTYDAIGDDGYCYYVANECRDSDPCTNDFCLAGECFNMEVNCDDGNPCTNDFCAAVGGNGWCDYDSIPGCFYPADSVFVE